MENYSWVVKKVREIYQPTFNAIFCRIKSLENSGYGYDVVSVTTPTYNHTLGEEVLLVDSSSNSVAITLEDPTGMLLSSGGYGKVTIKVIDYVNPISVTTPSGKIVDNNDITSSSNSFSFSLVGESITLITDGVNYYII